LAGTKTNDGHVLPVVGITFVPEVASHIIELIRDGWTYRRILSEHPTYPSYSTFQRWREFVKAFDEEVTKAHSFKAEQLMDEAEEEARTATPADFFVKMPRASLYTKHAAMRNPGLYSERRAIPAPTAPGSFSADEAAQREMVAILQDRIDRKRAAEAAEKEKAQAKAAPKPKASPKAPTAP
jgi:hypothetical protein